MPVVKSFVPFSQDERVKAWKLKNREQLRLQALSAERDKIAEALERVGDELDKAHVEGNAQHTAFFEAKEKRLMKRDDEVRNEIIALGEKLQREGKPTEPSNGLRIFTVD